MKRKILHKIGLLSLLLILITSGFNKAICQCTVGGNQINATITDNVLASLYSIDATFGPNSSAINYAPNDPSLGSSGSAKHLYAVTWLDVTTAISHIMITDDGMGINVCNNTWTTAVGGSGDVIIGNNTSTNTDYLVGVVYITSGGDIDLDVYDVTGVGTVGVSFTGPATSTLVSGTFATYARINGIAEYGNLFPGGAASAMPLVDKFALVYEDNTGLNVYYASLNSPTGGSFYSLNTNTTQIYPDVAAVQRTVGLSTHDFALVSYTDNSITPTIAYQEVDMTANIVGSATVLATSTMNYKESRIEANDDFNNNNTAFLANYVVTWTDYAPPSTSNPAVMESNNMIAGSNPYGYDITECLFGTAGPLATQYSWNLYPDVALGPYFDLYTSPSYYSIGYVVYQKTGPPNNWYDFIVMQIDWTTGYPFTPSSPSYYEVPKTHNDAMAISLCSGDNCHHFSTYPPYKTIENLYNFWENDYNFGDLLEKGTSDPYVFKHPSSISNVEKKDEWQVSPNPATDFLTLTAPADLALCEKGICKITDITGRLLIEANINNQSEQVDISGLVPGIYIMHIYENNNKMKTEKFVKE